MSQYELVLEGEGPHGEMLTVLHYDVTAGDDPPDWDNVATIIRGDMVTHLQSILSPSVKYTGISVREDTPGAVGINYPFAGGDLVGTAADAEYAGQLALLVRKNANSTVNPNRGRIYQGGLTTEGLNADGDWNTTVRTACNNFWTDMIEINAVGPSTLRMVIKASNPAAPNTVAYNPVATVGAQPNPATQRRRRRGVGS